MNQFSLEAFTNAKLINFNPRAELEGKDRKPAADLKFEIKAPNTILSEFLPQLRDSFYWNSGEPLEQGEEMIANSYFGLLRQAQHSHHDRAPLANALRRRGHTIKGDLTKIYRRVS